MKINAIFIFFVLFISIINAQEIKDKNQIYEVTSTIDTLQILAGKPHVILIQIDKQKPRKEITFNKTEKNELQNNFNTNDFDLIVVEKHSIINFQNGQSIDVSNSENSYEAIVFWNGNLNDKFKVQENIKYSTEFVAKELNQNKKSSYVITSNRYKRELAMIPNFNNFTEKSLDLMHRFLQKYAVPEFCFIQENCLFNTEQNNVKSITGFLIDENNVQIKTEEILLNENGLPIQKIKYSLDDGSVYSTFNFEYNNNVLSSIKHDETQQNVIFNDNELIIISDLESTFVTTIYSIQNNLLLKKEYFINKGTRDDDKNFFTTEKYEGNCVKDFSNDHLFKTNCFSEIGLYPYVHEFKMFKNGQEQITSTYKIDSINENEYKISVKNSGTDLEYESIITLNTKKLVESITPTNKVSSKKYQLEYTYYN